MKLRLTFFSIALSLLVPLFTHAAECVYNTWEWNTFTRRSENHRTVRKPKEKIDPEERGTIPGCTVCLSDQVELSIPGLPQFRVCKKLKEPIKKALQVILKSGYPLASIDGYRVGRSKGKIDSRGFRQSFSNHSYGTAIDINSQANGLYSNCVHFGPHCRLLRGGRWEPNHPLSIAKDSIVVNAFRQMGFKWGGEIEGRQKDFMHFSRTGY